MQLLHNSDDLGIIYINKDVDLIYIILALSVSLALSTAIYFFITGVKSVVFDERDYIVAEIKSCSRFVVQKLLDDNCFRNNFLLIGGFGLN